MTALIPKICRSRWITAKPEVIAKMTGIGSLREVHEERPLSILWESAFEQRTWKFAELGIPNMHCLLAEVH
jgi:hypothetical protein